MVTIPQSRSGDPNRSLVSVPIQECGAPTCRGSNHEITEKSACHSCHSRVAGFLEGCPKSTPYDKGCF